MTFECPNVKCRQPLEVDDEDADGFKFSCPACGQTIEIEPPDVQTKREGPQPSSMTSSTDRLCPKCKQHVDSSANKCPNCGALFLGKRLRMTTHSKALIAETMDGLAFAPAINAHTDRLSSFTLRFKILFGVFIPLQIFFGLAWFNLGPQQAAELKRNIPFLTQLLLLPSFGIVLTYVIMFPATFYAMNKSAPQCISCRRKIKYIWDIKRCLNTGACPFCGFSRNGPPTQKTNKRGCSTGCACVVMYIFSVSLIIAGVLVGFCPAGLLLMAVGIGVGGTASLLLKRKQ